MAIKLVTVNPHPEQSAKLFTAVSEQLKGKGKPEISLEGNADSVDSAKAVFEQHKPDLIGIASVFTPEESAKILADAKSANPDVKLLDIPHGLQAEKGPEGVIAYAVDELSKLF